MKLGGVHPNHLSTFRKLHINTNSRHPLPGISSSKSSQSCADSAISGGLAKSPESSRRLNLLSPDAARARHLSSASSTSATSGESGTGTHRNTGVSGGSGGSHLIKHRKFMGGGSGGASAKSHDKSREAQASVVLVGYKHKPATDGQREVAVGTLVDSNYSVNSMIGLGAQSATSTSGISSSSNDLDAFDETLESEETTSSYGRPPIHSSGSAPYLTQLNGINGGALITDSTGGFDTAEANVLLQQRQLLQQRNHLMLQEVPLSGVEEPASTMMQSSLSGSLPDLANQEIVIDFPPQMTKSQQLMDQFQADSSNNILEAVDGVGENGEEEKISVYDLLVETMQVKDQRAC